MANCRQEAPRDPRYTSEDASKYSQPEQNTETSARQPVYETFFIHSDRSPIYAGPSTSTVKSDSLNAFERVEAFASPGTGFIQLSQPIHGFIDRDKVYDEDEMYEYARSETDWYNELDKVCKGLTPLQDIQQNDNGRPAYGPDRRWTDDEQHKIRYTRATLLDVFTKASHRSDVVGQLKKNHRVIVDSKYKPRSDWAKIVYPYEGYIDKNSLFNEAQIKGRLGRQALLINKVNVALGLPLLEGLIAPPKPTVARVAQATVVAQTTPKPRTSTPRTYRKPSASTKQVGTPTKIIPYDAQRMNLTEKIIVVETPKEQVVETPVQQVVELAIQGVVEPELVIQKDPVIEIPVIEAEPILNIDSLIVDVPPINLDAERNDYPINIVNRRLLPDTSLTTRWNDYAILDKSLYEGVDSIVMLDYGDNKLRVTALGAMAPYYIPIEKNFTRLGIPYGGSVELSKAKWPVSFGVGYNSMRATTTSMVYILDAKDINLFAKYTPIKLLNDHMELFVNAGVTGWDVNIMNDKYPLHQDYYQPEAARGIGYMGGAGALYEYKKFLLGLQYQHYGTPLVIMGPDFSEPETQEELSEFIPTTQYRLYAGAHQFQVIVGYRIN